jgi:hypothetical protein
MKTRKRILAGFALILASTMMIASLTVGIGVWFVKEPVTRRATSLFDRIEAALGAADFGLDQAKSSLSRALIRLDEIAAQQRKLMQDPPKIDPGRKFMARTLQKKFASEFGDAQAKLQTVAEAAVVVNSVLEDMGNIPGLSMPGLQGSKLEAIGGQLSEVTSSALELSRLLGESTPSSESDGFNEHLSRVEAALHAMQKLLAEYEPRFAHVRQRTAELRARTLGSIAPSTVVIAIVCFWIALSQVIVLSCTWRWWKRS